MFKYVKTIGAHCGAPEPELFAINNASNMPAGCLCELLNGRITSSDNDGKSKFITLERKVANDGKTKIKCIRVLPGMLFDVDFDGDTANAPAGDFVSPALDDEGFLTLCEEGGTNIEVVDTSKYNNTGKITVTIHC